MTMPQLVRDATVHIEPCTDRERQFMAALLSAAEQSKRDVQIAWTMYCHARGLPLSAEIEGVTDTGLLVRLPSG